MFRHRRFDLQCFIIKAVFRVTKSWEDENIGDIRTRRVIYARRFENSSENWLLGGVHRVHQVSNCTVFCSIFQFSRPPHLYRSSGYDVLSVRISNFSILPNSGPYFCFQNTYVPVKTSLQINHLRGQFYYCLRSLLDYDIIYEQLTIYEDNLSFTETV